MPTLATATKRITAEEFAALPNLLDGSKLEFVRGEIVTMPPPKVVHGIVQVNIAILLGQFVKPVRLGWIVTESGVVLVRDPDTDRGPDVAFYIIQRQPTPPEDYFEILPDLAIEIRPPGDRPGHMREKVRE
jgi:Uma2 family endonuclease